MHSYLSHVVLFSNLFSNSAVYSEICFLRKFYLIEYAGNIYFYVYRVCSLMFLLNRFWVHVLIPIINHK